MRMHLVSLGPEPAQTEPLSRHLGAAGHDVTVVALPHAAAADSSTVGHRLADEWTGSPPDVVLAHGWAAGLAVLVATREVPVPVAQRFFGLTDRRADPDRARLESAIARSADLVLAGSVAELEHLVTLGVRRDTVRVVPLGVDTAVFTDRGPALPRRGGPRLVAPLAGDAATVHSLLRLVANIPGCELALISSAPDREHRNAAAHERVQVLHAPDDDTLAALLRATDCAVAGAHDAEVSALVVQAMACGVPIVAPADGPTADVVADGITGVLMPRSAPDRLPDRVLSEVRSLLRDATRRESMALAAVDRAQARFAWAVVAASTAHALAELAGDEVADGLAADQSLADQPLADQPLAAIPG